MSEDCPASWERGRSVSSGSGPFARTAGTGRHWDKPETALGDRCSRRLSGRAELPRVSGAAPEGTQPICRRIRRVAAARSRRAGFPIVGRGDDRAAKTCNALNRVSIVARKTSSRIVLRASSRTVPARHAGGGAGGEMVWRQGYRGIYGLIPRAKPHVTIQRPALRLPSGTSRNSGPTGRSFSGWSGGTSPSATRRRSSGFCGSSCSRS